MLVRWVEFRAGCASLLLIASCECRSLAANGAPATTAAGGAFERQVARPRTSNGWEIELDDFQLCLRHGADVPSCIGSPERRRLEPFDARGAAGPRVIAFADSEGILAVCDERGATRTWVGPGVAPALGTGESNGDDVDCSAIATGDGVVCRLRASGSADCWGRATGGHFASQYPGDVDIVWDGPARSWTDRPCVEPFSGPVRALALGGRMMCGVLVSANSRLGVECFGRNVDEMRFWDQDVQRRPSDYPPPYQAAGPRGFSMAASFVDVGTCGWRGPSVACAADATHVSCWKDERAEICTSEACSCDAGPDRQRLGGVCVVPIAVATHEPQIVDVRVDGDRACILDDSHDLWCWTPCTLAETHPRLVASGVDAFDLSLESGCFVRVDGGVWCWGKIARLQFPVQYAAGGEPESPPGVEVAGYPVSW